MFILTSCNGQEKPIVQNDNPSFGSAKLPFPKGGNMDVRIVTAMEDAAGNIWLGSIGEGLFKYDGKSFLHFGMEQGLNSEAIYSILQDKAGNIWVGTNKALNRFDGNAFENIPIVFNSTNSYFNTNRNSIRSPSKNTVWSMMQDKNGTLWLGTDEGVYCYNGKTFNRFIDNPNLLNKDSLSLKGIFSMVEDKEGNIWFAECSGEGISRYDGKSITTLIPYNEIRRTDRIIEDHQHNLWFATAFKGIGKYDGKTFSQNYFKDQDLNGSYSILEDKSGNLWFDTQNGLGFYDGNKLSILTEIEGTNSKEFIPILLDKAGNVWFSCKGMKLYKYDGKRITNYSE